MKAAAYARYSTDNQTENSIATQLDGITRYCQQNGHTIVAVYSDEAQTGFYADRTGFANLVQAAQRHEFECVVVYDVTRGSRNVVDWFQFRQKMLEVGVKVLSVTENLGDILDPNAFFMELINVGMGQHQVLQSRQKSIAGKRTKAKEGVFLGGVPPLGYDIVDRKYVINEREATVVRRIFDLYADGHSYDYIMLDIKKFNVMGKRGRPVGKNSLYSILHNDRYIGIYSWNRHNNRVMHKWSGGRETPEVATVIENAIPPIIDMETWERVQTRMSNKANSARNTAKTSYLLTGKIVCGKCGAAFVGRTSTNNRGVKTTTYCCGNKYRTKTCVAVNINAAELENAVIEYVKNWIQNIDFEQVASEMALIKMRNTDEAYQREIELLNIDIKNTRDLVSICTSDSQRDTLIKQLDTLEKRRNEKLDAKLKAAETGYSVTDIIEKLKKDAQSLKKADIRHLVKKYVQKIYAHDDRIEIITGVSTHGSSGRKYLQYTTVFIKLKKSYLQVSPAKLFCHV